MRASSIYLLATGMTLLCLAHPLYSVPQRSYLTNYETHTTVDSRTYPVHQVFSERHSSPSIQRGPVQVTRDMHQINDFQSPAGFMSYPERVPEASITRAGEYQRYVDFPSSNRDESKQDRENIDKEDKEGDLHDEDVIEKMKILDKLLSDDSNDKDLDTNGIHDKIIPEESRRVIRQVQKQKPGFFWTLARVTFETFNDTRSAIKQISEIIGNNIAPESATRSTKTTASLTVPDSTSTGANTTAVNATETTTSSPGSTTPAPYVLTRSTLQRIVRRNVLGLVRLFNIEWKDALNQSDRTVTEFQKSLGNQVGVYLRDDPNAY